MHAYKFGMCATMYGEMKIGQKIWCAVHLTMDDHEGFPDGFRILLWKEAGDITLSNILKVSIRKTKYE